MKRAIVIGGGLGGLAAAVTLQHRGYQVTVLEKNSHFGGKLMPMLLGRHYFDFGPNTITMPHVFRRVIEQTGEKAEDYFEMVRLPVHTRNVFADDSTFAFTSDKAAMLRQLTDLDPFAAERYEVFLQEIRRLYELSEKHFLPRLFTGWRDYLSPALGSALLQVRPFQTLHDFFRMYFQNENLLQALDRYATYIGSSPYAAPATFAMIAHLELSEGVYYVKGGNTRIAAGYARLAGKLGAELRTGAEVRSILVQKGQATGVVLADGQEVMADVVIMNADLLRAYPELVAPEHRPRFSDEKAASYEPSISAFVVLAGLTIRNEGLLHHNVFFSDDYEEEFKSLFTDNDYAAKPTIYVCNSSYTDPSVSPDGDNLFILVNAPSTKKRHIHENAQAYKERIYDMLEAKGISIRQHLAAERVISPLDIESMFGAHKGALYGISSNKRKNAFLRPYNRSQDIRNLYFVGGTTHPGGGSPMVTISGMNVAEAIAAEPTMQF